MFLPLFALALAVTTPVVDTTPTAHAAPTVNSAPLPVYNGRKQQVEVRLPRLEGGIAVDGVLDEPQWKQAAVLTGFSQYSPADGVMAEDSIEVLVWYSATAINFGIRAFEAHGAVHATLAQRDKIDSDDFVQLLIGTFNDGRQAMLFGVNPLGIQQDGIITETGILRGGSGFASAGIIREAPDMNPDFVFHSKGHVTAKGYEVEVSIPFKTLRFQPKAEQTWSLQIIRKVQHNGHEEVWAPAKRAAASFLNQSGHLVGLTDMRRGLVLDLNPEVTQHTDGAINTTSGNFGYTTPRPTVGGNVRWGITDNITLNGTIRPDFSQVEADVVQLSFDPRRAIAYPEKRPFFLEGIEQFNVPNQLIYTRDIIQPDAAVKLTGKVAGTNIAYLSAVDGGQYSFDHSNPIFNVFRAQRDFSGASRLGVAYTDVIDGSDWNRVGDVDARLVWNKIYSVQAQFAESFDHTAGQTAIAPMWYARIDRTGHNLGLRFITNAVADSFITRAGFVARAGIGHMNASARYIFFGKRGDFLESLTPDVSLDNTWTYHDFIRAGEVQDLKWHFGLTGAFRGGWQINTAAFVETFGYDSTLFLNYFVAKPRVGGGIDTVKFTGTPHLPNLDLSVTIATPQLKYVDASLNFIVGKDENFYEWANSNVLITTFQFDIRPSEQFRINGIYKEQKYLRRTDNSDVALIRIPRLKVEYQLTRSIFLRYVGQYESDHVDSLRDESRTQAPLLVCTAGTCTRLVATNKNSLRSDWLFAYQPIPGTVFFLGYGATDIENQPLRFSGLTRQVNGFFVKASYLYRM